MDKGEREIDREREREREREYVGGLDKQLNVRTSAHSERNRRIYLIDGKRGRESEREREKEREKDVDTRDEKEGQVKRKIKENIDFPGYMHGPFMEV